MHSGMIEKQKISNVIKTILCCFISLQIFSPSNGHAQNIVSSADSEETWSYHFQFTTIQQMHGSFSAKYSGINSLNDSSENDYSVTSTLFLGTRLWHSGELYCNPEMSGGSGFSSTTGIAGFPNGEVYRVSDVAPKVVVARVFFRQIFSLGDETEKIGEDQNTLAGLSPKERLTITVGKFSLTDIFDNNAFSHDPRTQFMNWSLWAPGAWDYAADTRGYDYGLAAELHQLTWTFNLAVVMMPTIANGSQFDTHINKAYSINAELVRQFVIFDREGKLHLIGFYNHAHMGNYQEAIDDAEINHDTPDITSTRSYCSKYGFALSVEQPLSEIVGMFSRLSWNDGRTETFVFTEIDQSFNIGVNVRGDAWKRNDDNAGLAVVVNGLSDDHRYYLAAGGYGFLIGDGQLNYGLEQIVETFYDLKLASSFWLTADYQIVINPAYNKDRGPEVNIFGIRGHVEL